MSISDGQPANQTTFNNAFPSRTVDTTMSGQVDLLNADSESGDTIENVQRELNSEASYTGKAINAAKDALPAWSSTAAGAAGDDLTERAEALTAEFDPATGHDHDGVNSKAISADDLSTVRLKGSFVRASDLTSVTGSSVVVTTEMSGKTASSGDTVKGVIVATNNKAILQDNSAGTYGDQLRDTNGQVIYGRLTKASTVWTLSFYKLVAGVETAHTFSAQDIGWFYQELFNPVTDAPIYNELAFLPPPAPDTQDSIVVTGSRASPTGVTAGGGVAFTGSQIKKISFVQGSGGAVTVSANPQVAAGVRVGQELVLIGRNDTNTLTLADGTGLALNGGCVLSANSVLSLVWDGTNWVEVNRNDV